MCRRKIIRSTTVPSSLETFLETSIETMVQYFDLILLSSEGKELDNLKKKYGIRTIAVPMERKISIVKDIKALSSLIKVFRREKPDIVHSMTPKAGLLCMVAAWVCRVPKRIHTFTGLIWPTSTGLKRKILMATDCLTCACATHIIPEGEGVKNDLQQHITKKKMKVLGYGNVRGVDMDYWKVTPEIKSEAIKRFPRNCFYFIFVGRIVKDKGINELVEAFIKLKEHYQTNNIGQSIKLILVGKFEDDLDPISEKTRKRIQQSSSITYVGPQYGKNLLIHYAASDCFILPSYREGFPNTVLEAGAMGLPSIVTDINGSREIIVESENGIIVPPKDIDALYFAMMRIVKNNEEREKMSRNARPMIECRFNRAFVQKCLLDYYDKIS